MRKSFLTTLIKKEESLERGNMKSGRYFLIIILFFSFISCDFSSTPFYCSRPPCVFINPHPFEIQSLYVAVKRGDKEEVERILINERHKFKEIEHGTIKKALFVVRSLDMAKFVLSKGAEVNIKDKDDYTPLHEAYNVEIAKFLIEQGADATAKSKSGYTPLHEARSVAIAKLLIEHGADINAKTKVNQFNIVGLTPLDTAKLGLRKKVVKFLKAELKKQSQKNTP